MCVEDDIVQHTIVFQVPGPAVTDAGLFFTLPRDLVSRSMDEGTLKGWRVRRLFTPTACPEMAFIYFDYLKPSNYLLDMQSAAFSANQSINVGSAIPIIPVNSNGMGPTEDPPFVKATGATLPYQERLRINWGQYTSLFNAGAVSTANGVAILTLEFMFGPKKRTLGFAEPSSSANPCPSC